MTKRAQSYHTPTFNAKLSLAISQDLWSPGLDRKVSMSRHPMAVAT